LLVTLRDARRLPIANLPKKESGLPEGLTAIHALMLVEQNGPSMFARIGVMRALNRGHVREFNPSRKDPHWGRRKLKRIMAVPIRHRAGLASPTIWTPFPSWFLRLCWMPSGDTCAARIGPSAGAAGAEV
jgi:hypothetical protein